MKHPQKCGNNNTDKENTMATKPTKQQVAQAKARAGGNNPIKVTNSGLKKLGSAALLAASFTPVGRAAKVAATVAKATKTAKAEGVMAKTAAAAKTAQIAKNSVKAKPAAKPVGNTANESRAFERMVSSVSRGSLRQGGTAGKNRDTRVFNSKTEKNTVPSAKNPKRVPEVKARGTVKINSAKTVRVVKVAPKKK